MSSPTMFPLNDRVWDRIRERMEKRSMTRFEYTALARYWRVRRRAMRQSQRSHPHAHHGRLLRRAEEDLARAVTMAYIAEKWAPTMRALNSMIESVNDAAKRAARALAPLAQAFATAKAEGLIAIEPGDDDG
jgi:hypothetical protein